MMTTSSPTDPSPLSHSPAQPIAQPVMSPVSPIGGNTTVSDGSASISAEETVPTATFDYIVCSEFDKEKGLVISKQYPLDLPLVSNQLDNMLGLVMPSNLHKYLNTEHYTLVPLYIDLTTSLLSYSKDTPTFVPCYLYSVSYFQKDDTYRNGTARAISIVTRLPIVQAFKPLLYFLLRKQFGCDPVDYSDVESVWSAINGLSIPSAVFHYLNIPLDSRFLLARLSQGHVKVPAKLAAQLKLDPNAVSSGSSIKQTVPLGDTDFPIQIPQCSLLCSKTGAFGSDLQKDTNLRSFLQTLANVEVDYVDQGGISSSVDGLDSAVSTNSSSSSASSTYRECDVAPYPGISALCVLLNAVILHKRILLYCYDGCYNAVFDFGSALLSLFNGESDYPFYPILDLATLDLVTKEKCPYYVIGTSNLLFKERLDWDVYFDMDLDKITVRATKSSGTLAADSMFFDRGGRSVEDRHMSIIGAGIKNLLFHRNVSGSQQSAQANSGNKALSKSGLNGTPGSEASSITSFASPESISASKLSMWEPAYFPHVNHDKINRFLDTPRDPHFFQFGFQFQKIPYSTSIFSSNGVRIATPALDVRLEKQVKTLLAEHHTDMTIYVVLTNYLRSLTSNVLPAFYHYLNRFRLAEYQSFIDLKLRDEDYVKSSRSSTSTPLELRNYIRNEKLVQPFAINYFYAPESTFIDDERIAKHYAKLVYRNRQMLSLALAYNSRIFTASSASQKQIPGFLFDWQGEVLRYDPYYALSILDQLVDDSAVESWQLNGNFLLQFYKSINQILKNDKSSLPRLLADFFVQDDPLTSVSESEPKGKEVDVLTDCYERGFSRFDKLIVIAATYQVAKESISVKRKKDLTLTEFKKVLSAVLNNTFFKDYMLHHLDDFMKLNINDFIDYHM